MANLKQLSHREVRLTGGHRLCPGCGEPIAVRQILMSTETVSYTHLRAHET